MKQMDTQTKVEIIERLPKWIADESELSNLPTRKVSLDFQIKSTSILQIEIHRPFLLGRSGLPPTTKHGMLSRLEMMHVMEIHPTFQNKVLFYSVVDQLLAIKWARGVAIQNVQNENLKKSLLKRCESVGELRINNLHGTWSSYTPKFLIFHEPETYFIFEKTEKPEAREFTPETLARGGLEPLTKVIDIEEILRREAQTLRDAKPTAVPN